MGFLFRLLEHVNKFYYSSQYKIKRICSSLGLIWIIYRANVGPLYKYSIPCNAKQLVRWQNGLSTCGRTMSDLCPTKDQQSPQYDVRMKY